MLFTLCVASIFILSPQSQPPRDRPLPRTPVAESSGREAELEKRIAASPTGVAAYIELSKLQETRGSLSDAEQTLLRARQTVPTSKDVLTALAAFYNRQGDFTKTMDALDAVERQDPTDPAAPQMIATYYWEKAYKDQRLLPAEKYKYILSGIEATDRALALKPDYVDALTYKNLLLRLRANQETDPVLKQQLIAEADALRNRAIELNKQRTAINSNNSAVAMPPPPPPPPPPTDGPVRVGNGIKVPTKITDVRPLYPPEAQEARIQGIVIIEATIDREGNVTDGRVLKSIPLLDEPALAAVRQWKFTPTIVDGAPVPVIMTVTVKFSLE